MVRRGGGPCVLMYQTIEVQPGVYMNVYRSGHGHHQTTQTCNSALYYY